jgi:hypothetical protein
MFHVTVFLFLFLFLIVVLCPFTPYSPFLPFLLVASMHPESLRLIHRGRRPVKGVGIVELQNQRVEEEVLVNIDHIRIIVITLAVEGRVATIAVICPGRPPRMILSMKRVSLTITIAHYCVNSLCLMRIDGLCIQLRTFSSSYAYFYFVCLILFFV